MPEENYSFTNPAMPRRQSGGVVNDAIRRGVGARTPFADLQRAIYTQQLQAAQMQMETDAYKRDIDIKARMGQRVMAEFIATNIGTANFGTESTLKGLYSIANQYAMPDSVIGPYVDQINQSIARRRLADTLTNTTPPGMEPSIGVDPKTGQQYKTFRPDNESKPADLKVIEDAEKYYRLADEAKANKDPDGFQKYKAQGDARMGTVQKQGTRISYDDMNRPVIQMGGNSVPLGYQTQALTKETSNRIGLQEIDKLDSMLKSDAVGIVGVIKDDFINKGLSQIYPGTFDKDVSDSRYMIRKVMETTIKSFASDSRITDQDAKRIIQMLPSPSAWTSFPKVKADIKNVRASLKTSMRELARSQRKMPPFEAMTPQELQTHFNEEVARVERQVNESEKTKAQGIEEYNALKSQYDELLSVVTRD